MMRNKRAMTLFLFSFLLIGIIAIPAVVSSMSDVVTVGNAGTITPSAILTITSAAGGTTNPIPGSYSVPVGTQYSVKATASSGYTFGYWNLDGTNVGSTNPISVTMNADHALQAVFAQNQPPPSSLPKYGVCMHQGYSSEYPVSQSLLADLASAGSFWTRGDVSGSSRDISYWAYAKPLGIYFLGLLVQASATQSGWQALVQKAVTALPDLPAWELLNEPEQSYGGPRPVSASDAVAMIIYAADYIHVYSTYGGFVPNGVTKNPYVQVIAPACSVNSPDYLHALCQGGIADHIDGYSAHGGYFGQTGFATFESYVTMYGKKSNGQTPPIWITECGYQSGDSSTEAAQNSFLVQYYSPTSGIIGHDSMIQVCFWYNLIDATYPPNLGNDDGWGLAYHNLVHKQAYATFKSYLASS